MLRGEAISLLSKSGFTAGLRLPLGYTSAEGARCRTALRPTSSSAQAQVLCAWALIGATRRQPSPRTRCRASAFRCVYGWHC